MRRLLFLAGLFLWLNQPCYSQHFQSIFGKHSTSWVVSWGNLFGQTQSTFTIQKDTIVNNITYKKIILTAIHPYESGLIREDTIAGKVWYKAIHSTRFNPNDTLEKLAFDFNLAVGDTFDISNANLGDPGNYPDSLNIVDTIYYHNNLKYIGFKAKVNFGTQERLLFIEGIGSNKGIVYKDFGTGVMAGQYLLCSYKNGMKTGYTNLANNGSCNITGLAKADNIPELKIYPNPVENKLFVALPPSNKIKSIKIINQLGQQLAYNENFSEGFIDISNLPSGLYKLQILLNKNLLITKKFQKI